MFQNKSSVSPARAHWVAAGLLAVLLLATGNVSHAATYALAIDQPQAGLTTTNRYYKAYPGLTYDVAIAAVGGKYPYTYTLPASPSGMTVNSSTGEISWPSPTASGTPYAVTAQVTDSAGTTTKVSWTITVTTAGFVFVDAVNGKTAASGGNGSAASPFKTIADFYLTKYDTTYKGQFVYFKSGTYSTATAPLEDSPPRIALEGAAKPLVWLAYPGQTPVMDTSGAYICIYSGEDNVYFEGLSIQNFAQNFGVRIDSSGNNVVFRNNTFSNLPASAGGVGSNASALMIADGGGIGNNWAILTNTFTNITGVGYGLLGYATNNTLVQGNTFTNFGNVQNIAIGPKDSNTMWFIRNNRINISQGQGIWIDTYTVLQNNANFEISYNLVQVGSGYTFWLGQQAGGYGPVTSFRNTYVGATVEVDNLTSSDGPVTFTNDVIVSSSGSVAAAVSSLLSLSTDLTGTSSTGIVDSSGNLAGNYTKYLGIDGYQQTGSSSAPPTSGGGGTTTAAVVPDPPSSVTVN
jgi:Putative Ig domain